MAAYLSGNEALDGVGEHDDTGKEEPRGGGHRVFTVVVQQVTCSCEAHSRYNVQVRAVDNPWYTCIYMYIKLTITCSNIYMYNVMLHVSQLNA